MIQCGSAMNTARDFPSFHLSSAFLDFLAFLVYSASQSLAIIDGQKFVLVRRLPLKRYRFEIVWGYSFWDYAGSYPNIINVTGFLT